MINAHHRQITKVGAKETAFVVVKRLVHAVNDAVGFLFRDESHAAVAFLLRGKPIVMVAHHLKVHQRDLVGRGLQLLKAEYIRLIIVDPLQQAFVDGRTDAVHVVADDFHRIMF